MKITINRELLSDNYIISKFFMPSRIYSVKLANYRFSFKDNIITKYDIDFKFSYMGKSRINGRDIIKMH